MHLLQRIERYMRRSGARPARIGRDSVRDPRLVFDMRCGRELRPATAERVAAWLEQAERRLGER